MLHQFSRPQEYYEIRQLWLTSSSGLRLFPGNMDTRWKWMLPYLLIDFPNRIFYGIFGSLIGPSQPYLAFATNVDLATINLLWTLGKENHFRVPSKKTCFLRNPRFELNPCFPGGSLEKATAQFSFHMLEKEKKKSKQREKSSDTIN